ncbi:TIGR02444 family protein [Pseudomonas typographi]|uniref:TIGR02444 family protein n=1 Tax=Pseudomonas typographi TaxID=2715964 RepID=A0ABR7Z355_9PSED|nr:TIGR02444 family protein [Pseudomonas typographi]MBD1550172.1 TIGR02444 family protein [Pseudomonas typographi]MBD1586068.1 TIGR02444 family protein [Pseudomonas typographi]MBD1599926.1 TIGR02444 family protein [Pseudomonas typographi]
MSKGLWAFAVQWYARPGVEPTCLALQAAGANVCLLLCAAWLGQRGVRYQAERCEALQAQAGHWHAEVIAPLRHVRQQWRAEAAHDAALHGLREQLKALELAAEKELLQRLERATAEWPPEQAEDLEQWLASSLKGLNEEALQAWLASGGF